MSFFIGYDKLKMFLQLQMEEGVTDMKKTGLIIIIVILIFVMSACAHVVTVQETYTSTGQKGYIIDCSGDSDTHLIMPNPTWADCQIKAGEICGERGFEILDRSDQQGELSSTSVLAAKNQGTETFLGVTKFYRSMLIKCKS